MSDVKIKLSVDCAAYERPAPTAFPGDSRSALLLASTSYRHVKIPLSPGQEAETVIVRRWLSHISFVQSS